MKAVVLDHSCSAEEMPLKDIPVPQVCSGWVLVKVKAFGLNHSEVILRIHEINNSYIQKPIVPGIECAGIIADASDSDLHIGDAVVALMGGMGRSFNGSYAEYALLPRKNVFKIEQGSLTWEQIAAIPETYYTACGSLFECLLLKPEDTLLVRGATSTVGQAAIQVAHAIGAKVIATSRSSRSFDKMKSIGADACLTDDGNLRAQMTHEIRPNKVLELIGPSTLPDSMSSVSHPGYVCCTGVLGNKFAFSNFNPIRDIPNGVFLSSFYSNYPTKQAIDHIFGFIREHRLKPLYSRRFTLEQICEAHELLEHGGAGGKIVIVV